MAGKIQMETTVGFHSTPIQMPKIYIKKEAQYPNAQNILKTKQKKNPTKFKPCGNVKYYSHSRAFFFLQK